MDSRSKKWLVKPQGYRRSWNLLRVVQQLLSIEGFEGVLVRILLLTGFNKEEIMSLHRKQVCSSNSLNCTCGDLHVLLGSDDLTFVSLSEGYAILPKKLWQQFRGLEFLNDDDFAMVGLGCKAKGVDIEDLAEIHRIVISYSEEILELNQVLSEYKLDTVTKEVPNLLRSFLIAWEAFGQEL